MASFWNIIIPKETTNLIVNPSFETNTTGWTTGGTNTITQVSSQSVFGNYSLEANYSNNVTMASYAITILDVAHIFSAWIYVPANWDGGLISLLPTGFTSATIGTSTTVANTAIWTRIEISINPDSGDLAGALTVISAGAATSGRDIYIDGVQMEALSSITTYTDGDQPGATWLTTPHASTSTRNGQEPSGGTVSNFADDLSYNAGLDPGAGMPPVSNTSSPFPKQPGRLYEDQQVQERQIVLGGTIKATTPVDFHTKKQALVKALDPKTIKINELPKPRTLRYTAATVDKEITGVYDGGLEAGLPGGFTDAALNIRLLCNDPIFKQVGNQSQLMAQTSFSSTVLGSINLETGLMSDNGPPNASGTYTSLLALAERDGILYIGGDFTNFDNIANADYIVQYNIATDTYTAMGTTTNGVVNSIAIDADGTVYAVGNFTEIGGVTADRIASWNGSSWSDFTGGGLANAQARVVAIDEVGDIWVGGDFTTTPSDRLARWDISAGSFATHTANASVYTIDFDANNVPYVGGNFTDIDGDTVTRIASYDGSNWQQLGTGAAAIVRNIAITPGNIIYAAGDFTTIGTVVVGNTFVAAWNGASWSQLGTRTFGTNIFGMSLAADGKLYVTDAAVPQYVWIEQTWVATTIQTALATKRVVLSTSRGIFYGGDAGTAVANNNLTTISYSGSANAYPTVIIANATGGGREAINEIFNVTTGSHLYLNRDLEIGETITIVTRPGQQSITSNFAGDVSSMLLPVSNLGEFYLTPGNESGAKDNVILAFTPSVSAFMKVWFQWQDSFISQD